MRRTLISSGSTLENYSDRFPASAGRRLPAWISAKRRADRRAGKLARKIEI